MSKDLFSSRTPFEKCYLVENVKHLSFIPGNRTLRTAHVNRIFKAFLDGEWMPPIYVSADGEVLDGQNRSIFYDPLENPRIKIRWVN